MDRDPTVDDPATGIELVADDATVGAFLANDFAGEVARVLDGEAQTGVGRGGGDIWKYFARTHRQALLHEAAVKVRLPQHQRAEQHEPVAALCHVHCDVEVLDLDAVDSSRACVPELGYRSAIHVVGSEQATGPPR